MRRVIFIHRNLDSGYSINKVSQTFISGIADKEEHYLPYAGAKPIDVIRNIAYCIKLRNRNHIFHITGDVHYCVLAFVGCKTVLTIHDTVLLDFIQSGPIKHFLFQLLWYRLPILFATKVVCISQETKKHVQKYSSRKDISVIYNAVEYDYGSEEIEYTFRNERPRILFIGTNPNKNLVRSFNALKGLDCELRIVGRLNKDQLSGLSENGLDYTNIYGLTDEQIRDEYLQADIVSFISLFEGFGMIVIESNALGRPIICSDIPVLREIAADSALFVNPYDSSSIRQGYLNLLKDFSLRKELIRKGKENVLRFEKNYVFRKWVSLYDSLH